MPEDRTRLERAIKLAYELAQTGMFDDFGAIEDELVALGYGGEAPALTRPGISEALDEVCAVSVRERNGPTWH